MRELVIAARSSPLSRWQARTVADALEKSHPGLRVRIDYFTTIGDRRLDSPLSGIGDKGLFTKELETALLDRRADIAVHSLKDVQTSLHEALVLAAVTRREHVEDALVAPPGTTLDTLPEGATVATGSLRRRAQLLAIRRDLKVVDVRGNLGTRLSKYENHGWGGMILARAGLERLGLADRIAEVLPPDRMVPAVGQGALAIESRADDDDTLRLLETIQDGDTRLATDAERSFLRRLEGGCQAPIGAWGRVVDGDLTLDGVIAGLDGEQIVRGRITSHANVGSGVELAERLLAEGGSRILAGIRQKEEQ